MTLQDQPIRQRQIRVFISSTFRDMKVERDYLVRFIFPQLRRLCEQRQVVWGEVDLRWGVTDEQAAEGKVLPICLEEIMRCRPYFIGLLGERYGWVPEAIPREAIDREPWLKEHVQGKKSVTELEILHGVLNNPEMADHAFFYFRDPDYLNHLPAGSNRADFESETPESMAKLAELKERIRRSNRFPVRENYPDPKALGELVLRDLTAVIDTLFPEGSQPDPLDREAMDHEAFARSRERVYIGRPAYFDRLDAYVERPRNQPMVILGESGSGKSALLANWVSHFRAKHPDVLILQHYIGATPYSADWAQMVRRIMGEFKRNFGIQREIPDKPEELRSAFPNWLYMAGAKGKVILVLDALNQLEDRDGAPDLVWLPPVMPKNVKLVVSTLPGRPLEEITKRGYPTQTIQLLTMDERKELIRQFLKDYGRELSPARVERIAGAGQSANPLFLRVLLDELRQFGEHERLEEPISHYLQAESVSELYCRVIERWDEDYNAGIDLVHQSLSSLWASRRGLTEAELLDILGKDGQPLPRAIWSPLFLAMSDSLVSRCGLLTFAHDFLRLAAREICIPTASDQQQAHMRLADYYDSPNAEGRQRDELIWQLAKAKALVRLKSQLTNAETVRRFTNTLRYHELLEYWLIVTSVDQIPQAYYESWMSGLFSVLAESQAAGSDTVPVEPYLKAAPLALMIGSFLIEIGQFKKARAFIKSALDLYNRFDNDSPEIAIALVYLGRAAMHDNDIETAESHLSDAIRITKILGLQNDPSMGYVFAQLMEVYSKKGDRKSAERMFTSAIRCLQECFGAESHQVAECIANFAVVLYHFEDYSQAEEYYLKALMLLTRIVGLEHPETIAVTSNLAGLYRELDELPKAESLINTAMKAAERSLGQWHPVTKYVLTEFALILDAKGTHEADGQIHRLAKWTPPPTIAEHKNTSVSEELFDERDKDYDNIISRYRNEIAARERVLGADHPEIAEILRALGNVQYMNSEYDAAEISLKRAASILEKHLGGQNIETGRCIYDLACVLNSAGKHADAEILLERAKIIIEGNLGKEHTHYAACLTNLGATLSNNGKYDVAEAMELEALGIYEKMLGHTHPLTAMCLSNLGIVLKRAGKWSSAEGAYGRALAIYENISPRDNLSIALVLNELARCKAFQNDMESVVDYCRRILDIEKATPGFEKIRSLLDVFNRIVQAGLRESDDESDKS